MNREPSILYFREDEFVENVVAALDLTEDTFGSGFRAEARRWRNALQGLSKERCGNPHPAAASPWW